MLLDNFYTILSSESSDSTIWTIQVKLNPGHPVYQGHFPGHPAIIAHYFKSLRIRTLIRKKEKAYPYNGL